MSQHKFRLVRDGKLISVLAGWDRPLQQVFCMIEGELLQPENLQEMGEAEQDAFWETYEEAHEFLFNNLLTPLPHVDAIGEALAKNGLPCPQGFLVQIEVDRLCNAGNRVVDYGLLEVAVLPQLGKASPSVLP